MSISGRDLSELIFIIVMMVLFAVLSFACIYFFIKQYRKEMREKEEKDRNSE
jgi:flagellar basal body-associated protein FliL